MPTNWWVSAMLQKIAEVALNHPALIYTGPRKMLQDLTWSINGAALGKLPKYPDVGYGGNKQKQLIRTYWNETEADRVRQILARRENQTFTSVAMSMRNQAKDSRSMGWCMNSLVITRLARRKFESVEIQYRSVELTMKFGGDLCFLPWMLDQLDLEPDIVRFRFANGYFSGVYLQYLAHHWTGGPVPMLDYIWRKDRKFFEHGTGHFFRSTLREDQTFKYSPENLAHRFGWKHIDMKAAYRYLRQKYKEMGRPMPHRTMVTDDEEE